MGFLDNLKKVPVSRLPDKVKEYIANEDQFFYVNIKKRIAVTTFSTYDLKKMKNRHLHNKTHIYVKGVGTLYVHKTIYMKSSSIIVSLVIQAVIAADLGEDKYYSSNCDRLKLYSVTNIGGYFFNARFAASDPFIRGMKVINPGNVYRRSMDMKYFIKALNGLKSHMTASQKKVDRYNRRLQKLLKMLPTKTEHEKKMPKFELLQVKNRELRGVTFYDDLPL